MADRPHISRFDCVNDCGAWVHAEGDVCDVCARRIAAGDEDFDLPTTISRAVGLGPIISSNAVSSVQAALANPSKERTPDEAAYDEVLRSCVLKPEGHVQKPSLATFTRLYTVTTIASSARFGGTRTVVVCDSFDAARKIVEENHGDIWENSYMLAVIEGVAANRLYTYLDETYWYRWQGSRENGGYHAIETPEAYKNRYGFGVG